MKRLTKSKLSLWAIGHAIGFAVVAAIVPSTLLIDTLNGVFIGILAAVMLTYFPLVWSEFHKTDFDRAGQLAIGIILLWISLGLQRLWSFTMRHFGSPIEYANSPAIAFFIFLACLGGGLFVTSPGYYPPPPIPFGGHNRRLLICFAFIGGALAIYLHYR